MLKSTLGKGLAALMLGVSGLLAPVGQAGAAVFIGAFDPSFGGTTLGDLGFRGQATFFIPDACLNGSDPGFFVTCSGEMSMTNATVDLYRYSINPLDPTPTLSSAFFAPPAVSLIDALIGTDPETEQNTLVGVNTPVVGPQLVNVFDGAGSIYNGNLWLEFHQPHPVYTDSFTTFALSSPPVFPVPEGAPGGAYLFACAATSGPALCESPELLSDVALVTFTQVPEPATLVLVLSALAVAALTRRRHSSMG